MVDKYIFYPILSLLINERKQMTDITKYRNVSLTHETYKTLIALSKVLLPDGKLSISVLPVKVMATLKYKTFMT